MSADGWSGTRRGQNTLFPSPFDQVAGMLAFARLGQGESRLASAFRAAGKSSLSSSSPGQSASIVAFEANDLSFSYDNEFIALDHVNLSIENGEQVAILGANGSGKSTLLKVLDGLYFSTHGRVFAFGQSLTEAAFQDQDFNFAFRRKVGLLFQDSDVQLFSASVWDEVAFAPLQLGLDQKEVIERVEFALKTLRIEFASTTPTPPTFRR